MLTHHVRPLEVDENKGDYGPLAKATAILC